MSNNLPTMPGQPPDGWPQELIPAGTPYTDIPAGELPSSDGGLDWRHYLVVLWRYKWLILLVTLLGTGAGALATRFMAPVYEAQATIWIESASGRDRGGRGEGGPIQASQLLQSYSWVDLLQSYLVLDSVAVGLRLYLDAEPMDRAALANFELTDGFRQGKYRLVIGSDGRSFRLLSAEDQQLQQGVRGDSVGAHLGFRWVPPASAFVAGRTIEFAVGNPRVAASRLSSNLSARLDQNGNFMRLSLSGSAPEVVAQSLNAVSERFRIVASQLKAEKLAQIEAILGEQREYAEDKLRAAESDLENFRVQTITLPSERASPVTPGLEMTQDPAFANFFDLKVEQDQIRRDRESIERALKQVPDSGLSVEALEFISAVQGSSELEQALGDLTDKRAELRALMRSYSDEHQLVRDAKEEIRALEKVTIPSLARRLVNELASREDELEGRIASASTELSNIPPRAIQEAALQRRVDISADFYNELQVRHEQALLAAANNIPDVRVLDQAVPPRRPTNTKERLRLILMAFMASMGLAVVGALLLDRLDPRIRYPDEVTRGLGVSILGTVPHMGNGGGTGRGGSTIEVVEAFRLIRLGVIHAYGTAGPVVITITSPSGSEGKSFVSTNLALSFAELGRRTVVVDADVRRGQLHHVLGGTRKPGLTDCLAGRIQARSVIHTTQHPNLDHISCGTRRQDGPELLQSAAMARLVDSLRSAYEVILVDTPPIGVGADALALATLTGNLIVVLRTGSTGRELTEAKLDLLDRLPVRVLGAILNDVPERGPYKYGYQSYKSYLPGYEAWDEDEQGALLEGGEAARGEESEAALGEELEDAEPVGGPGRGEASHAGDSPNDETGSEEYFSMPEKGATGEPRQDQQQPEETDALHRQHQRRTQQRHWHQ